MKFSFLRFAVLSISVLSASLVSVKLFEVHLHFNTHPEAKRDQQQVVVNPAPVSDPQVVPPTRISFHRGTTGQTISGNIAHVKGYVLRAKQGQHLTATVTSTNNCVAFSPGTTTVTYTTVKGDNVLGLVNNCSGQSTFSLTVSIL